MVKICSLWLKTSKEGKKFFAGKPGTDAPSSYMVFKNERKKNATDPDYNLFLVENKSDYKAKPKREEPTKTYQEQETRNHSNDGYRTEFKSAPENFGQPPDAFEDAPF